MFIVEGKNYSFDTAWDTFLRILPKYMNSHYFDIMTYSCGVIAFIFMMLFRRRIKSFSARVVYKKYDYDIYHRDNPNFKALIIYRIINLIIPVCAGIISMMGYSMISSMSDRIKIHSYWFYVAPLVPVGIYTIFEFFESGILGSIVALYVMSRISYYNTLFCEENEDHHKACYAVRLIIVTFGIIGLIKQFSPPLKSLWSAYKIRKKEKKSLPNSEP